MTAVLAVLLLFVPMMVQAVVVNNGVAASVTTNQIEGWPVGPDTYSETAVLIDADTGAVLYDKGKDEIRYPASMTKVMSVLVAVENASLDAEVTFTETGIRDVAADSTNIGMQLGEVMSLKSCLHAMLIKSANEVSAQVAEYVGGTEAQFVEMMNQKAAEIGCTNTHFANASGLPDENHYTTAYDMAKIMQAALQNETFRELIGQVSYTIPATNMSEARGLHTSIPLMAEEVADWYYEGGIGAKSGLTSVAQYTLVMAAERGGCTYLGVTMRAADFGQTCMDMKVLLDYGFQSFEKITAEGQGSVTVPKGVGLDGLEMQESVSDGAVLKHYFYKGQPMGMLKEVLPTPTSEATEGSPEQTGAENTAGQAETAAQDGGLETGLNEDGAEADSADGHLMDGESAAGKNAVSELFAGKTMLLLGIMGVMLLVLVILIAALSIKRKKRKKHRSKR